MKNLFVALLVSTAAFSLSAEVVKIQLPQETAVYKSAPGADLANAQCLTCHSAEYVSSQPPLSRTFWKSSVDKMIGKYGASIPAEQVEPIVDYIVKNYGNEATNTTATAQTQIAKVNTPAALTDAKALAVKMGCLNCHQIDNKILGPAFKDVAKKYAGKADGHAKVTHQITNGGMGQWGPIPMPPFKQLSSSEVNTLAEWVLSQSK